MTSGFPKTIQQEVLEVLKILPWKAAISHDIADNGFTYTLGDGEICFPARIYFHEPSERKIQSLTKQQQNILHCIYSRHHNGFVREKHISELLAEDISEWAIPYVVKICDEYVVEILKMVYENLKEKDTSRIKQFCADNYAAFCKSYNRMISYWNEYYRNDCCEFKNYIGRKLFIQCFGAKRKMNFIDNSIVELNEVPELIGTAALWFHGKWNVPEQAYIDSMTNALKSESGVPRWYVVLSDEKEIIAGLGVIENDFHKRPDLTPNICAMYVEEPFRCRGIARALLDNACAKLLEKGIDTAYLITSHTEFYERCGWTFYDMIEEDDGNMIRMYRKKG